VSAAPVSGTVFDSIAELREMGFRGFFSVSRLRDSRCVEIPAERGVYIVIRDTLLPPKFMEQSVGGRFRQMDPTVPVDVLSEHWVGGTFVLFIGRARGPGVRALLQQRVKRYIRFGQGRVVAHYGGRFIWQLKDHRVLLLAWMPTPDEDPSVVEERLLSAFVERYGKPPFANLKIGDAE
jgi:hypothetical protein